ncbi:hypothetical protein [Comamonas sp. GB3 AK4-5]|uniref:hypothetical protein n=1 Tax=Comamonas sp. GB3 AK4-5 TaxID=3231487 RepID=UPI00351F189F
MSALIKQTLINKNSGHANRKESLIKIHDQKSSSLFIKNNQPASTLIEFFYDGKIVKNVIACDRILICDQSTNISAVELKGSDLRHAMEQLEETFKRENIKSSTSKKTAVIVYSQSPSNISTAKQNFAEKMFKTYKARVFYCKSGSNVSYSEIL